MEIKERPILFSASMILAILEGRKTQTRRVIKPRGKQLLSDYINETDKHDKAHIYSRIEDDSGQLIKTVELCPYGKPGDRLWVRETFGIANSEDGICILYPADHDRKYIDNAYQFEKDTGHWAADLEGGVEGRYRPSIHMPRWASRINLEITNIRVERLQEITWQDALAEGVDHSGNIKTFINKGHARSKFGEGQAVARFMHLWHSINGKTFPVSDNPWVWVVEFRRI